MMKNNSIFLGWPKIMLALVALFRGLLRPAYCETGGPALLVQQMPPNGGTITPGPGVHYCELNASVTLQAIPQPGYHFVYWLGDVGDPTSNRTTVYLDAPKIVIAVFERTVYAVIEMPAESITGGFWGGIMPSVADYSRRGGGGGGGDKPRKPKPPQPPEPPKHDPEIPVPVPEPATVVLLAFGGFLAFAGRRPKKLTRTKAGDKTLK
ncbi:MAG TPA: PEP-CTERM sorting domain-containing protein [Planctomycetes bacterium]|nr:PEP-CTERM sorting domain-containing protein [Planctomycetota bacterium]